MALMIAPIQATAGPDWSLTEIHLQYGSLKNPDFQGGGNLDTFITTLHHVSLWGPADVFFFTDLQSIEGGNTDVYSEIYAGLSLGKLSHRKIGWGPIRDIGLRIGFNGSFDDEIRKYLPGIRLSWEVPGFRSLNTDILAFLDGSSGAGQGSAPKQTNSVNIDVDWSRPFQLGGARFLLFGHVEYAGTRHNEFGKRVSWWVLGQPQFRYDLGYALYHKPDQLYTGIEWQFWINKQGESGTNENAVQALLVWRF